MFGFICYACCCWARALKSEVFTDSLEDCSPCLGSFTESIELCQYFVPYRCLIMADGTKQLPPAASGLFLEVSFRRLLSSCEEIAAGDCKGREDLKSWKTSPVFHCYVETLQDQLAELSKSAGERMDSQVLELYRGHVAALAAQLGRPELSAPSPPPAAFSNGLPRSPLLPLRVPTLPPLPLNDSNSKKEGSGEGPAGAAQGTQPASRALVGGPAAATAAAGLKPPPPRPGFAAAAAAAPPPVTSQAAQSRLQTQANLQEALTDELAGMAASLKSSTLAVEGKLKERGQLLESTEAALDHSLTHTKQSAAEAKRIHSKGRINFCLTMLVMLVVGLVFAGMFVFIKFTSFAGYRAARATAAVSPPPTVAVPGAGHGEL